MMQSSRSRPPGVIGDAAHLLATIADGLWVLDRSGTTTWANPAFTALTGRVLAEHLVGVDVMTLVAPHDRARMTEHLDALAAGRTPSGELYCSLQRSDGVTVPVAIRSTAVGSAEGPGGWLHRAREDLDRHPMMDALQNRESQLKEAQSIARTGSWALDHTTGALSWSPEMFRVMKVDPATFDPRLEGFVDLLHAEDREMVLTQYQVLVAEQREVEVDVRLHPAPGHRTSDRWVRIRGRVMQVENGIVVISQGTAQDVTEPRETAQAMAFLKAMAALANRSATLADVATADTAVRDLSRWPLIHVAIPDRHHPGMLLHLPGWEQIGAGAEAQARSLAERAASLRRVVWGTSDLGSYIIAGPAMAADGIGCVIVSDTRSPFAPDATGRAVFDQLLLLLASVVEREAAATELAGARDAACAASRAKSDFLATMSHEIRTPLNGVIGLTELLADTGLDAHQRHLTEALDQAGRTLLSLIDDILDLSKIEAGHLDLEEISFDPVRVLRDSVSLLTGRADEKQLLLTVTAAPDVPPTLQGDPVRFGQVVTNLVANAVKFTEVGDIVVRIGARRPLGADAVELLVEVCDSGIGVHPDVEACLFKPFVQADVSTTRRYGGTGLGLAISARIVESLHGEIGVDSTPGTGSTFWFTARFPPPTSADPVAPGRAAPGPSSAGAPGLPTRDGTPVRPRVLVAEDDPTNQLVAAGLLNAIGYEAVVVGDGSAAVRALEADPAGFHAVLMDGQMPVMDGWAATRLIRSNTRPGGRHVPIIALTASVTSEVQARCDEAGMDAYLTKPIAASTLRTALGAIDDLSPTLTRPSDPVPPVTGLSS